MLYIEAKLLQPSLISGPGICQYYLLENHRLRGKEFWNIHAKDGVRTALLRITVDTQVNKVPLKTRDSLEAFVEQGFFFIEALKWPLIRTYKELLPKLRALTKHSIQSLFAGENRLQKYERFGGLPLPIVSSCQSPFGLYRPATGRSQL